MSLVVRAVSSLMRTLLIGALVVGLSACAGWGPSRPAAEPYLIHVVLVWLKQPGNLEHRQQIMAASESLREIPGVLDLRVGQVVHSDRPVVEDSYDVGLVLRFANAQDLQHYLSHPLHVNAVKQRFVPVMQRYQVMDFVSTGGS